MKIRKYIPSVLAAWLLFIGIDFLFHASILESLWKDDVSIFKPARDLALLIPAGYLSFLLLTSLVAFVFFSVFQSRPSRVEIQKFALIFATLFSISNLLALYSFADIPLKHLILFNLVYLIEICAVVFVLDRMHFSVKKKKVLRSILLFFLLLLITGFIIQNL